jgi:hypothetical protein
MGCLLQKQCKADTGSHRFIARRACCFDIWRQELAHLDDALRVGPLVVGEAEDILVWKLGRQIPFTQRERIDPKLDGDLVHEQFLREHGRRTSNATVGPDRALVGRHSAERRFVAVQVVRARQHFGDHSWVAARGEGPHRVGPNVHGDIGFKAKHLAFRGNVGLEGVHMIARMDASDEVFSPILDPFHRAANADREPGDEHLLSKDVPLNAKPAANLRRNDVDLVLGPVQLFCQVGA